MIFEQDTIGFQILDVLHFDQSDVKKYNFKRNFDALSFRYEADTIIEYKDKRLYFTDNSIGFFPSDINSKVSCIFHFNHLTFPFEEITYL